MTELPQASRIEVPDSHVIGVPADFASVWHTPESFVIDFLSVRGPDAVAEDEQGQQVLVRELVVSARVRMPPTHVIELMKALEQQLTAWETQTGQRPPAQPPHPDLA
jgi:hypothetical protein